jgi:hypothetical protein
MDAAVGQLPDAWSQVRAPLIVPLLRLSVAVCLGMAVLLFLERLYMGVVIVGVKLLRRTPERRYKCDPISEEEDPELGSAAFPSVLVQIPMFNEREVHSTFLRPPIGICRARSSFSSSLWFPFGHWFSQSCTEVQGWVNVIINLLLFVHTCRCISCRSAQCAGCRGRRIGWWCRCWTTPRTPSSR